MKKILILGANGQIAREAIEMFLSQKDIELTLYLRNSKRLKYLENNSRVYIVDADVSNLSELETSMKDKDLIYANLAGSLENHAKNIITAMNKTGLKRLIFISSMGIYDEVPGQTYKSILDPYRNSVKIIENSDLDYTIIRPAWLSNENCINYDTTVKGELFRNEDDYVSRKSVADFIIKLANNASFGIKESFGIHRKNR